MKRKPGRPRKNAAIEKPIGELSSYRVDYRLGDGTAAFKFIDAQAFEIAQNGDLLLTRDGAPIAAFRDWQTIGKMQESGIAIPANDKTIASDAEPQRLWPTDLSAFNNALDAA